MIRPSPSGRYYALLGRNLAGDQGWLFTRNGHEVAIPESVPRVRAVAWSPDERGTALATSQSVYIYESDQPEGRVVGVPLEVGGLDWTEQPTVAALP